MAHRILSDTIDKKLVKRDPAAGDSKRKAGYIPAWGYALASQEPPSSNHSLLKLPQLEGATPPKNYFLTV